MPVRADCPLTIDGQVAYSFRLVLVQVRDLFADQDQKGIGGLGAEPTVRSSLAVRRAETHKALDD